MNAPRFGSTRSGSALPRERFRVAMVAACPMPARRGTPLRIERLAHALHERGNDVHVVAYHVCDDDSSLAVAVHRIFGRSVQRPMPPGPTLRKLLLYDPSLAWKLSRVLSQQRFDVIHAHHVEGVLASVPSRLQKRLPLIYDAHTSIASELPSYGASALGATAQRLGTWIDAALPRLADHVVSVTPDIRRRLIEQHHQSASRISVVSNGVELERFACSHASRRDDLTRIAYCGTLAKYQDVELLLEAFAMALRSRSDLRLMLCVSTAFEGYERIARALGVRHAIEIVPDDFSKLAERLQCTAIAALPRTRCDGIPQKLLNYMAAGKAIVASAGSAKVLVHERTGLVVPDGDAAAFARALLRLAAAPDLAEALGRNARSYVEKHHSWERAAGQLEQIYAQVCAAAARGVHGHVVG